MEYEYVKCLKGGSTCQTFLVKMKDSGEYRFLKEMACEGEHRDFFNTEAMILRKKLHQGIPVLTSVEERDGKLCILEEYIDGTSFDALLKEVRTPEPLIACVIQVCHILQSLHEAGYVYMDVKAEHVICEKRRVCLIDFGNCHRIGEEVREKLTIHYAAPEQFQGGVVGAYTDIYSIGMLLMEIVQRFGELTHLQGVVERCLHPQSSRRYQSMQELISALTQKNVTPPQICVWGIRAYVGCTHLALTMGRYFQKKGRDAVYISGGVRDAYQGLRENHVLRQDRKGRNEYQGLPVRNADWQYLQNGDGEDIHIYDYGCFAHARGNVFACEGATEIVVISGAAPWNNRKALITVMQQLLQRSGKRPIFVGNFMTREDCKILSGYIGEEVLCMPFYFMEQMEHVEVQRFLRQLERRL